MKKKTRDDAVMRKFFEWRETYRRRLLNSPTAQRHPRLFALGYLLSEMFDWEEFTCFPSRETIAAELGISTTQVSTLTKELATAGFITIRRRRNASAIYVGTIPQEVKCSSHPDDILETQDVKSSPVRKSSAVHIGKSSGLHPNVDTNVDYNEEGAPLRGSAPYSTDHAYIERDDPDLTEDAPEYAPEGASCASSRLIIEESAEIEFVTYAAEDDAAVEFENDEARENFIRYLRLYLPSPIIVRLLNLADRGELLVAAIHEAVDAAMCEEVENV